MYRVVAFSTNGVGETIYEVKEDFTEDEREEALSRFIDVKQKYGSTFFVRLAEIQAGQVVSMTE